MKIAAAQIRPIENNTNENIKIHLRMIDEAAQQHVQLIVFPELSLTGYERELASQLAFSEKDERLEVFIEKAKAHQMLIITGAPIKINEQLFIGAFVFLPDGSQAIYTKQYLHGEEEKYFIPNFNYNPLIEFENEKISLAICADISNIQHSINASKKQTTLYIASIFYTSSGIAEAYTQLSNYAKNYSMNILMSNYCGASYNMAAAGQSACWNTAGKLIQQLNNTEENLLIVTI